MMNKKQDFSMNLARVGRSNYNNNNNNNNQLMQLTNPNDFNVITISINIRHHL